MGAMESVKALIEKMGAIYSEMQALVNDANNSPDGMSVEMKSKFESLKGQYAALREQRSRNDEMLALADGISVNVIPDVPEIRTASRKVADKPASDFERRSTEEYRAAFEKYLRNGEYTGPSEMRALSEASGGTVIPPTEFDNQLVTKLQTMTSVRNLCRKISLGSFAREVAYENATGTAYWTSEGNAPSAESGSTFAKITLTPKRLSCLLRVSNELVADADARGGNFGISSILSEQFARIFAQTEETALLSATSVSGAPASLLANASLATSAASQTSITAAQIISWVYSLPRQYRVHPSVAIITNDATLGAIRQLAASGLYFWENGYAKGGAGMAPEPDRLLGIPVVTSAAMPTIPTSGTTSTKVAIIGAWDYCIMGTTGNYELKVLRERYADTNETGYLANMRMDCQLTLPGLAFSALQCQT